jgi:hypothetical protein
MIFDELINDWYIGESVLDIPRDGLDPNVFQFPETGAPIINNRIKQQIIDGVSQIHLILPVQDYYVIGSILTTKYNEHSDIDVNCEVDVNINPVALENIIALLKNINGRLAIGTQHPINFFIVKGEFDHDKTEAIYDIANDRWIKEADEQPFNVRKFMNKFKSKLSGIDIATAELRRDLIDYDELDDLDETDISNIEFEVKKVLANIEADVSKIVQMYDNAKLIRKRAFAKDMSPMDIREFGRKNNLPDNIVYKMMERYFYKELAMKLRPVLDDDIDESDIPKIKKTFKDFLGNI